MASPKAVVRHALLNYPTLFKNPLQVLQHLFCNIGNGYEWDANGELSRCRLRGEKDSKTMLFDDLEKDEANILDDIKRYGRESMRFMRSLITTRQLGVSAEYAQRQWIAANIKAICNADLTAVYFGPKSGDRSYYTRNLSIKYSLGLNFYDNISPEWAKVLYQFLQKWQQDLTALYGPQSDMKKDYRDTPWWPAEAIEARDAIEQAQRNLWPILHDGQSWEDGRAALKKAFEPIFAALRGEETVDAVVEV